MKLLLAASTVLLTFTLAAPALGATTPANNESFTGVSAHTKFGIYIHTPCSTKAITCPFVSDRKTGAVGIGLFVGDKPTRRCADVGIEEEFATPLKGNTFAQVAGSAGITFTISETFTSATRVSGKIVAPMGCGGTDTVTAKLSTVFVPPTPPHGV